MHTGNESWGSKWSSYAPVVNLGDLFARDAVPDYDTWVFADLRAWQDQSFSQ